MKASTAGKILIKTIARLSGKVEPGSSRQQSYNESVIYSTDRRENGYSIKVVVIAARNGEMISNQDFTLKDYEKREDAKGKVSFHGSFILNYPW